MLRSKLPSLNDKEGLSVPTGLPEVIDAHVHIFPKGIFSAIWKWFDAHAWNIRYQLRTTQIFDFLLSRGIKHIVALQYAHKPGIAGKLNRYLAKKCREYPNQVTGMATIFPGENHAEGILQEAFGLGLGGLKLHAHVQCFDMNLVYDICRSNSKPIVMHVGREPKSTAYNCDPYIICSADKLESVLRNFPGLRICVPHFGFDEILAYKKLIEKYDNLWLDTTMILAGYFPMEETIELDKYRIDRIMYGSDFPNIPYAWDRELKWLGTSGLPQEKLEWILSKSADKFFGFD
ncbi:MAG: amidohydrolase family protein [Deltaproteobacteria bacterium]|nr:amidohydrolase family protein [Deltaproteobacteria bacterium]